MEVTNANSSRGHYMAGWKEPKFRWFLWIDRTHGLSARYVQPIPIHKCLWYVTADACKWAIYTVIVVVWWPIAVVSYFVWLWVPILVVLDWMGFKVRF
jgi:hypothetical protein